MTGTAEHRSNQDYAADPPASGENFAALSRLLRACTAELMRSYGVIGLVPAADTATADESALAGVDFSGSDLRGTLGLQAGPALVAATYEYALGKPMTQVDLEDWTCELANQLLGRLKNELLRSYGTGFSVNIPRRLWSPSTTELVNARRHRFEWDGASLCVYLDVLFAPSTQLDAQSPSEDVPDEGELLMF